MMEAVAQRKAQWLFNASGHKSFSGKRRPQEDMVTSAVFGSIQLLPLPDRREAIKLLLGDQCCKEFSFGKFDIEIKLWQKLRGLEKRRFVEPDVLLTCGGKTVVIEVKWHAPIGDQQIEKQIKAARYNGFDVAAAVILGEASTGEIEGTPSFHRTWREVSVDLQGKLREQSENGPVTRWMKSMRGFLQETDMGHVFGGIQIPYNTPALAFSFLKPGHPPWLDRALTWVEPISFELKGQNNAQP